MTPQKTVRRIGFILAIALLLSGIWLAGTVNAQSPGRVAGRGMGAMMGRNIAGYPIGATIAFTDTPPYGDPDDAWGMGHGIMRSAWRGAMTTGQTVTGVDDARLLAQTYLTTNGRGVTLGDPITPRPGGYRFAVLRNGKIVGIIRVNASSGEVWHDVWG
jgi:hypothetical protein